MSSTMSPEISVIVPIYNVDKYLHQCLDSLVQQTIADRMEFILVNDASTDRCSSIINEYVSKYSQFKAVHLSENRGYGAAVNSGIREARAPYIGILEPDDWAELQMYEILLLMLDQTGADFVKCGFWRYDSTQVDWNQDSYYFQPKGVDLRDVPEEGESMNIQVCPWLVAHHPSVWAGLYCEDFIRSIPFLDTPSASYQDLPFMTEAFCRGIFAVTSRPLVHWRCEPDQQHSTTACDERILRMVDSCQLACDIAERYELFPDLVDPLIAYATYNCRPMYYNAPAGLRSQFHQALKRLYERLYDSEYCNGQYLKRDDLSFINRILAT